MNKIKLMSVLMSVALAVLLCISSGYAALDIDEDTQKCITCHLEQGMAPRMIEMWENSKHAENGIGCLSCHQAEKDDFDAMDHNGFIVGLYPTPERLLSVP